MKLSLLFFLTACAAAAPALSSSSGSALPAGVLHMSIKARSSPQERFRQEVERARRLRKRASDTVEVDLDNSVQNGAYLAELTLGTPAQTVNVLIDTGSSDLWVQSVSNPSCEHTQDFCSTTQTFNSSESSTYSSTGTDFSITYADSSYASGVYVQDTLTLTSGVTLTNVTFGLADNSTSSLGVFGVGYAVNEAADTKYKNVPELLVEQGIIQAQAYSLWLNDIDASEGSILFGGIDTAKFTGDLQTVDVLSTVSDVYAQFIITLSGMTYNGSSNSTSLLGDSIRVVLDSGTSYAVLPYAVASDLAEAIGYEEYDSDYSLFIMDCSLQDSTDSVTLSFGDSSSGTATLDFGLDQLIVALETSSAGATRCALGVQTYSSDTSTETYSTDTTYILGDAFLRSGYFVYDLEQNQVSMADAVFNTDESNVQVINSTGVSGSTGSGHSGSSASSSSSSSSGASPIQLSRQLMLLCVAFTFAFMI
ncbi:aspartic peptidase domain-containing protein [Lipomyces oligophaga]|uniref:aspartic peptidase domain-containing protein n=1 Tax=Lipomyces oligophaga TaxID=45792 RepID=UPI0034CF4B80